MAKRISRRNQKKLLTLLVALLISGLGFLSERYAPAQDTLGSVSPGNYEVIEVNDGDTVTVSMDGKKERIRMIGVDTPETQDPRKPVQCFGKASTNFTRQLIGEQGVRLESDTLSSNRDRYNRLLRYVYTADGKLVQEEIIREGYGFAYTSFPFTESDNFKKLETEARQDNKGLWGLCQPELNQYGTFTSNNE